MKKILLIGGTQFVGRVLTETLLATNKYDIYHFNRGQTNADLFPQVTLIQGDKYTDDIHKIGAHTWDCVIDVAGYHPDNVRAILQIIHKKTRRYIFVSTTSHYDFNKINDLPIDENEPLIACSEEERLGQKPGEHYNARKAACEREINTFTDLDSIILRPSLIVGKYDRTDRLYCWLYRAKFSDKALLPDETYAFAMTFVEDMAEIIVQTIELKTHQKVYNLPTIPSMGIEEVVEIATAYFDRKLELVPYSSEKLKEQNIQPWMGIALWLSVDFFRFKRERLEADFSLNFTNKKTMIEKTIGYFDTLDWPIPISGISLEKENKLLLNNSNIQ